jgi:6-phosphofructokinase 1
MSNKKEIKRIAVFTSGGDSPGMNAAVRAVVRTALHRGIIVYGIKQGYDGMIRGLFDRLESSDVANIIQRGGTILKTARSMEFMTVEGRNRAYENLVEHEIDAVVAIGGNGTFTGAKVFMAEHDIPFIGLPGTIDNDLYGTDFTIGFDTALNTAMEAVDKIRDTAEAHDRLFFVEVMGRHSGFLALHSAISTGAGGVLVPEHEYKSDDLILHLKAAAKRKKKLFRIVIVAEGNKEGGAAVIAQKVKEKMPTMDVKVTVIGHLQRGGSPSSRDRILASRLGFAAVESLIEGRSGCMVGTIQGNVTYTLFDEAINHAKTVDADMIKMAEILSA